MSIIYMFPFPDVHIFCLNVSVGDNVTLQTGICLEPDFRVSWTRGRDFIGKEIAKYVNNTPVYPDKNLEDFLSLDVNSGSVTFIHITKELSGYYCLKLWEGLDEHSDTQFLIMVYEKVSTPQISSEPHLPDTTQSCHIKCCVENKPDVTLTLYRGDTVINCTSSQENSTDLWLSLEISRPSEDTYRCEAENPVCNASVTFNSTSWCPRPKTVFSGRMIIWIVLLLAVVFVFVNVGRWVCGKLNEDSGKPTLETPGCLEMNLSHEGSQAREERLGKKSADLLRNDPKESYNSFAETLT